MGEGQLHALMAHHNAVATRLSQCTGLPRATTNLAAYLDVASRFRIPIRQSTLMYPADM